MKYMTKEWYEKYELSFALKYVKKSKRAERKSEENYEVFYKKQCARFVDNERRSELYQDRREELKKLEEAINEPDITEQEREIRKNRAYTYEIINFSRLKKRLYYEFDEEITVNRFNIFIKEKIELYKHLPKRILDSIADIRVFALGYASEDVIEMLKPYCAELKEECEVIKNSAFDTTDKEEKRLIRRLHLDEIDGEIIKRITEANGNIFLDFDSCYRFCVMRGKITEGEDKPIIPFNAYYPYTGLSIALAAELQRAGEKFELSFLMCNVNAEGESEYWYLTIVGCDIKKK